MRLSLKTIVFAIGASAAIAVPSVLFIQPAAAETAADREAIARKLISETIPASHMPEIYNEMRTMLHTVFLPVMRDVASGKIPTDLPKDPKFVQANAKNLEFWELVLKASDEVDLFIKNNQEEMITDLAQFMAKHLSNDEIESARNALKLDITRKGFDVIYTTSKIMTGYTYNDLSIGQEHSFWLQPLLRRLMKGGQPPIINAAPTQPELAKAQTIVDDILQTARVDEMVADGVRFAREVVVKSLPAETQARTSAQVDQFELTYNMQKPALIAAAQTAIAQFMTDNELVEMHNLLQRPFFKKYLTGYYNIEKSITAVTLDDVSSARAFIEEMQKRNIEHPRTAEENAAAAADWEALGNKWREKFMNAVSPQTRDDLIKTWNEMQALQSSLWASDVN